eukprot:2286492-Prymnesium_polylepis.1
MRAKPGGKATKCYFAEDVLRGQLERTPPQGSGHRRPNTRTCARKLVRTRHAVSAAPECPFIGRDNPAANNVQRCAPKPPHSQLGQPPGRR